MILSSDLHRMALWAVPASKIKGAEDLTKVHPREDFGLLRSEQQGRPKPCRASQNEGPRSKRCRVPAPVPSTGQVPPPENRGPTRTRRCMAKGSGAPASGYAAGGRSRLCVGERSQAFPLRLAEGTGLLIQKIHYPICPPASPFSQANPTAAPAEANWWPPTSEGEDAPGFSRGLPVFQGEDRAFRANAYLVLACVFTQRRRCGRLTRAVDS